MEIPDCPRCGEAMSLTDETPRQFEYRCSNCYAREIVKKDKEKGAEGETEGEA